MNTFLAALTQVLTFLPLAFGISISYRLLKATDMTLDGSFVLGAGLFAKLIILGLPPLVAAGSGLLAGALAGVMVSLIQRGGKVDPLLAGVLATFILTSGNLIVMGRPNIDLLSAHTLVSSAFNQSSFAGWSLVAFYSALLCACAFILVRTRFGLLWRALGDNPNLLKRLGARLEGIRLSGFAFTNMLSASAGILTAQTIGYADIGMGIGMTLTGIGAIILGQQVFRVFNKAVPMRAFAEFTACLIGVMLYFFAMNLLLRFSVDPLYLKMILGLVLVIFLRAAVKPSTSKGGA